MIGLAIAGTLFVIPTAGEIPIIQTMLGFGVGAGPAGVLLMTLAPLSLPSLVMVSKVFPWRVVLVLAGATALIRMMAAGSRSPPGSEAYAGALAACSGVSASSISMTGMPSRIG